MNLSANKDSPASAQKSPSQVKKRSAWAKGPPPGPPGISPRSQAAAPINSHSRRPSNLGQGVPIKDGVSVSKNGVGALKRGSAVTFGSTNDEESIFPSPASSAPTGSEDIESFGSVPTTNYNGKSPLALPTKPKLGKMDLRKLFQNPRPPASPSTPMHTNTTTSPHQHQHPYQYHAYAPSANSLPPLQPGPPGGAQLAVTAAAFVPRPGRKITIKSQDGTEIDLRNLTTPPLTLGKGLVRIEPESAKIQRLAREKQKAECEEQARKEREESAEPAKLGQERILNEEEQQLKKESEEKEKRRITKKEAKKEKQRIRKEEKERLRDEEEEGRLMVDREEMERILNKSEQQREKEAKLGRLSLEEVERLKATTEVIAAENAEVTNEVGEGEIAEAASKSSSQTPDTRPEVKEKPKEVLRIDTTTTPLPKLGKQRPGPLDISSAQKSNIPAALPSALGTARIIDDLGRVPYPEGIKSPQAELNINAKDGKFRYDREFLLQFMAICKAKPDVHTPLDTLGIRADQAFYPKSRDDSGRRRQLPQSMAPPALARQNSTGLGISSSGFGKAGPPQFSMGKFTTATNGRPSAERFGTSFRAAPAVATPDVPLVHAQIIPTSQDAPSGEPASSVSSPVSIATGQIDQIADKAKTRKENEGHQQDIEWYKQEIGWYRQENGWYQQKIEWYQQVVEWYQQEIEWYQQMINMSHRGSHARNEGVDRQNPDSLASAGGLDLLQPPPKADNLSQFGKNDGTAPVTLLPTSVYASEQNGKVHDSASCTSPSQDIYTLPGDTDTPTDSAPSISGQPPVREPSFDIRHGGAPESPPHRRKLQLLPRSRPQDQMIAEATTSEADAKKIDEDLKEFFAIRNLDEAEVYFTTLPKEHHFRLVDKLVSSAIESKEADAQLVGNLFTRVASKGLCSAAAFEEGFAPTMELLDDIAIDVPKAFNLMATMMLGAGLEK